MIDVKFNETFSPQTFPTTEKELELYIERKMELYLRLEVTDAVIQQAKLQLDWIINKANEEGLSKKPLVGKIKVNEEANKIEIYIEKQKTRAIS